MHNAIKKAFTASVVATTIAWSIGLSAIPFAAKAATSGSLVKASLPAVYYVGADSKRYVFPNEKTYKTWYSDFSSVQTITDAELAAMPIGGNVTYKPGVRMVKITTDPKVYAVDASGTLRWVSTEAAAVALYGASWNQMIDDVPDAFFTNYSIGSDIASSSDFSPSSASAAALSINQDKGLSSGADGSLAVMASSPAAVGGTLPGGATGVEVLLFDVRNNGSNVLTLDSATVMREGPGLPGDWANVYLYDGNMRLTSGRTVNTTTHESVFGGLNMSIDPGVSKHMRVIADVAAVPGGGNVSHFSLKALTASGVSASGLPLSGPNFTMTTAGVGNVNMETSSTPSNPKAGELGAKVASFKLSETGAPGEDVMVQKVALYYSGSMNRSYLTNLVLKQSGTTLATASGISAKDIVTFVLATPFKLEKGSSRTFEVYGDVAGTAKQGDTIKFYLDQNSDILAIGSVYGWGASVNVGVGAGTVYNATNAPTLTVQAGQLTLTFNGPASVDVARDANDVELFNVTMSAQANLEVKKTVFTLALVGAGALATDFTDVKLVDTATGAVVAGPNTAGATVTFQNSYYLTAGQARTFKLTADIENTATDGDKITAGLNAFTASADVRNLDNSQYLTAGDFVPNTAIGGNPMTVRVPALTISGASTPVSQNYIVGSQGIDLLGFNLKANDASDLKVTQIVLTGYYDDDNNGTYNLTSPGLDNTTKVSDAILTMKLMNGSTQVGDLESAGSTTGKVTFDNLNLTIAKGQTMGLKLVGNLNSSISTVAAGTPNNVYFDIGVVGDVSAEDKDGNPLAAGQKSGAAFNATPTTKMAIKNAGSLSVALAPDDTDSEAGLVVGGSSNIVLGKYKLTAVDEELKLTKARFSVASVATTASLSLYDGSTLVGGPVSVDGNGMAYFSGMNFVIPKDGSKVLTVKGNLNSVGASGATTGLGATVTLQDGYQGTAIDGFFEARGTSAGSSTLIQEFGTLLADNDLAANAKVVRKTKPTISLVTLPTSTLSAGDQTVLRFTVAADAGGDVSFKEIVASVNKSGTVAVAKPSSDNMVMKQVGSSYLNATVTWSSPTLTIVLANEETVTAGQAKTYDILMNMTSAGSGDSVTSSLLGDTAVATGAYTGGLAGAHKFIWSDQSATAHGLATLDWANGWGVKTLPSDSQTLSK